MARIEGELDEIEVVVEVPRGGRVKRRGDGRLDLVSPLPCPFNYGSVPGRLAADGDALDALVLGPPLPRGSRARWPVHGVVRFVDDGLVDDKLICGPATPSAAELRKVRSFFLWYGRIKAIVGLARGRTGRTGLLGLEPR